MKKKIPIVYQGWMVSHVGFAEASRGYIQAIHDLGDYKIKTFPYEEDKRKLANAPLVDKIYKWEKTEIKERPIWISETGPHQIMPNLGYAIGVVVWELKRWPRIFIRNLKHQNELWAPTRFVLDGMRKNHLKNTHLVPHVVDPERFNPKTRKRIPSMVGRSLKCGGRLFRFLSIMGWSERKGVSDLIRAYVEEFNKDDNTLLYIKINHYNIQQAAREVALIRNKSGKPKHLQPWIVTDNKIYNWTEWPDLYMDADAFVLPSRGEGCGLNYIEAGMMELPVIATDYGPMNEYINDDNGYLIDVTGEKLERSCDKITPYYIGMKFPTISIGHLRRQMRKCYEDVHDGKNKGKQGRKDMIAKFSPKVVYPIIDKRLKAAWKSMHHFKLSQPVSSKFYR